MQLKHVRIFDNLVSKKQIDEIFDFCKNQSYKPKPGAKTLLYYANPQPKNYDDLGETFFIIDNEIQGVFPVPGRIVIFDAEVWHKATPLRTDDRYTVALKWSN